MDWSNIAPVVLFAAVLVVIFGTTRARRSRSRPWSEWVRNQPVSFTTRAVVRVRYEGSGTWSRLHGLDGAQLVVRTQALEVSLVGARGWFLGGIAWFLVAEDTTMQLDHVGWAGTPIGNRECILLSGRDAHGDILIAVAPAAPMPETWQALLQAGVRPVDGSRA
jgi:hypothetical protein